MKLKISAPGRICLFGEHQDYFGLPIIAAAINLRISISGKKRKDKFFKIEMPDIQEKDTFLIGKELAYLKERDYLRSALNVLQRKGVNFKNGWGCLIKGNIPINSGTSSSSALVVAWIKFLLNTANYSWAKDPSKIAELAYLAEVAEFKEPGGKMDHYTSALGGILYIQFNEKIKVESLRNPLGKFVLGDSLEKKDTKGILSRIKKGVLQGVNSVSQKTKGFNLKSSLIEEIEQEIEKLSLKNKKLLLGTLFTRDLTQQAKKLFMAEKFDHQTFGLLLNEHQIILRDYLEISTPKINRMIEASLEAGALGAKINGSGGGGCIFAYAPERFDQVAEAIKKEGGKPYLVKIDEGVKEDLL
ncbi:MAG: mevalonate kinase [Candidatus Aminicenantia bacterium]